MDLCTPLAQRDPAAAELLTRYFDHALAEQTYDALVAGELPACLTDGRVSCVSSRVGGGWLTSIGGTHRIYIITHTYLSTNPTGLSWSISTTSQGISLRFSGFSHKIQVGRSAAFLCVAPLYI